MRIHLWRSACAQAAQWIDARCTVTRHNHWQSAFVLACTVVYTESVTRSWVWAFSLMPLIGALGLARAQPPANGAPTESSASNERRRIDIDWSAPDGCPTNDEVTSEIQRLLATSSEQRTIDVKMHVVRGDDGVYALGVELAAPVAGKRALAHHDCGAVTRAATLVVALAIDADAVAVQSEQPSAETNVAATSTPQGTPQARAAQSTVLAADERRSSEGVKQAEAYEVESSQTLGGTWAAHVALGAHVEAALAPGAAWGPLVGFGAANDWLLAELVVGAIPGYVVTAPDTEVGATFEALWVEADVCAGMLRQRVNIALCIAGREYWMRATGRGVDEVLKPTTALFAVAGGPLLAFQLGAWRLLGVLQGVIPLARPTFIVDNLEQNVFRPPSVGVTGRLALSLSL